MSWEYIRKDFRIKRISNKSERRATYYLIEFKTDPTRERFFVMDKTCDKSNLDKRRLYLKFVRYNYNNYNNYKW